MFVGLAGGQHDQGVSTHTRSSPARATFFAACIFTPPCAAAHHPHASHAPPTPLSLSRSILIINNSGKPRLVKFYEQFTEAVQQAIVRETFSLLSKRSDSVCNFLEGGSVSALGKDTRRVYRHYATLFFVFAVDGSESELGILDLIQVFVEVLDKCFENVCELDLIFNCDKVHYILDEIVMGGMVLETNVGEIMEAIVEMQRLEASTRALGVKA